MHGGATDEEGRVCECRTGLRGEVLGFLFDSGSFSSLMTGHTATGAHELYLNMGRERLKLLWEWE